MRVSQNKSRPEETPKTGFHKPPTKVFAVASKVEKPFYAPCLQCKGKHSLWSCSVIKEKTPIQRAQFSAQNRLCFACFQPDHMFRKCPKTRKCTKPGCESTHNVLLHSAEKVFNVRSANSRQTDERDMINGSRHFLKMSLDVQKSSVCVARHIAAMTTSPISSSLAAKD